MKKSLLFILSLSASSLCAQTWNTTGNSGTNPSNNFLGTTDNQPLVFKANNTEAMRIFPNGKVKIGANDPVNNDSAFRIYQAENPILEVASSLSSFQIAKSTCDGCFGAQTGDTVFRNLGKTHNMIFAMPSNYNDGRYYIGIQDGANGTWVKFFNNATARFDGKIFAKEVEVKTNVWADYVFKKDYKLNSLEEVEKHIQEKGHLPNIPSSEKVLQDGINVAEMNVKLLEKIEELTLYSIEQNKKLKIQSEKVEKMEKQLEKLLSEKK